MLVAGLEQPYISTFDQTAIKAKIAHHHGSTHDLARDGLTQFYPWEPTLGLKILNFFLSPLVKPLERSVFNEMTVTFSKTRHKPMKPKVFKDSWKIAFQNFLWLMNFHQAFQDLNPRDHNVFSKLQMNVCSKQPTRFEGLMTSRFRTWSDFLLDWVRDFVHWRTDRLWQFIKTTAENV